MKLIGVGIDPWKLLDKKHDKQLQVANTEQLKLQDKSFNVIMEENLEDTPNKTKIT